MRIDTLISLMLMVLAGIIATALYTRLLGQTIPGATITSWWRTPWRNREVGGLANSAHLLGWALDIVPASPDMLAQAKARFPVAINEGDHIHAALYKA